MANGNDKPDLQLPKTVGIAYSDVHREYFPTEEAYITEKDALHDAQVIAGYLEKMGINARLYPGNEDLPEKLKHDRPDMVINLVDSVRGNEALSSSIPGVFELLNVPYTGVDTLGSSIDYNKFVTKKLLQENGVPVPNYQLFSTSTEPIDISMRFPLISKLNEIHGAVEITKTAVSENERELRERLKFLITTYKQPVLVEEFIVGKEYTAILLEGLNKKVYLAEKVFHKKDEKYVFATFEDQWVTEGYGPFTYQKYEDTLMKDYVRKAFDAVKMYDYGKFDIRVDSSGRYFFIDANTNPAFGPKELYCSISVILDMYGISFTGILKRLLLNTMRDSQGKERLPVPEDNSSQAQA